jgi:lipid-A-disaccharide synthase
MFGLDPNKPVLAIFPGSRPSEIDRYLPGMLAGVSILQKSHPEVQGIVGVAPSIGKAKIEPYLQGTSQVVAAKENPLQLMKVADAGLLKSGTSNLQAAFLSLPFVMFYKVPVWTEIIAKMLIKPKEYSIVNVLKSRTVVELTQRQTEASNVAEKLGLVLFDEVIRNNIKENFKQIVDELRTFDQSDKFARDGNAYQRTAILARELLVKSNS